MNPRVNTEDQIDAKGGAPGLELHPRVIPGRSIRRIPDRRPHASIVAPPTGAARLSW